MNTRRIWTVVLFTAACAAHALAQSDYRPQGLLASDLSRFLGGRKLDGEATQRCVDRVSRFQGATAGFAFERGPAIRRALAGLTSPVGADMQAARDALLRAVNGAPGSGEVYREMLRDLPPEDGAALTEFLQRIEGGRFPWSRHVTAAAQALGFEATAVQEIRTLARAAATRVLPYAREEVVRALAAWEQEAVPEQAAALADLEDFLVRELNDSLLSMAVEIRLRIGPEAFERLRAKVHELAEAGGVAPTPETDAPPPGITPRKLRLALGKVRLSSERAERVGQVLAGLDREDEAYFARIALAVDAALGRFTKGDDREAAAGADALESIFQEVPVAQVMWSELRLALDGESAAAVDRELQSAAELRGWTQEHLVAALAKLDLPPARAELVRGAVLAHTRECDPEFAALAATRLAAWGIQSELQGRRGVLRTIVAVQDFQQRKVDAALDRLLESLEANLGRDLHDRLMTEIMALGRARDRK